MAKIKIWLDMDGTIADLYNVPNWLERLRAGDVKVYEDAAPMFKGETLEALLLNLQRKGAEINILSWAGMDMTDAEVAATRGAKIRWLYQHFGRLTFDHVQVVPYGTNKFDCAGHEGWLVDDSEKVRATWENRCCVHPRCMIDLLEMLNALMN